MPESFDALARLTPAFPAACRGRVHSIFSRVVNVQMRCGETERLLALVFPDLPAVPDSVCLPPPLLAAFTVGETVILEDRRLSWRDHAVRLRADSRYTGKLDALEGRPLRAGPAARGSAASGGAGPEGGPLAGVYGAGKRTDALLR